MAKSLLWAYTLLLIGHSKAMTANMAAWAEAVVMAVWAIALPLREINPEMLSFGIIIDVWVVDYYGVDEIMGCFHRRDGVEICHLAIHRLKLRSVELVDADTVENPLCVIAFLLQSEVEGVAWIHIADGQAEARKPHTAVEDDGVLASRGEGEYAECVVPSAL